MSASKNVVLMGTSTAIRLGLGMLTFVAMARMLGPTHFGVLMYWMSIATLLSFVVNFGLTPHILREIGTSPSVAVSLVSEALSARLVLFASVCCMGLVLSAFLSVLDRYIFLVLLTAMLIDAVTETFWVGLRAMDRFSIETKLAAASAILQFVSVIVALSLWPRPLAAAVAFFVARLIGGVLSWVSLNRLMPTLRPAGFLRALHRIRATWAYALDFSLQSLFAQVDGVVLNFIGGSAAVGYHQAGMRLVQAAAQAAPILSNVFLPRIAAHASVGSGSASREASHVQWAFIAIGGACGLVLAAFAHQIVLLLFGADYGPLVALMPLFGALLYFRFCAAAWGILLTAEGKQGLRTVLTAAHWCVIGASAYAFRDASPNITWLSGLLVGTMFLALSYFAFSVRTRRPSSVLVATVVGIALLFLHFILSALP